MCRVGLPYIRSKSIYQLNNVRSENVSVLHTEKKT